MGRWYCLEVAQQGDFGDELQPRIVGAAFGQLAESAVGLLPSCPAGQERGAARFVPRQVSRVSSCSSQPRLPAKSLRFSASLRQRQVGLRQATLGSVCGLLACWASAT